MNPFVLAGYSLRLRYFHRCYMDETDSISFISRKTKSRVKLKKKPNKKQRSKQMYIETLNNSYHWKTYYTF